jgi:hypothetical protein
MMQRRFILVYAATLLGVGPVFALPLSTLENSYAFLVRKAAICMRFAPTEANPLRDRALIAELRQRGRLLDSFKCGRCRYDLAGHADAAYYVKTCGVLSLSAKP